MLPGLGQIPKRGRLRSCETGGMSLKPVISRDNPAFKQLRAVLSGTGSRRTATLLAGTKLIEAWHDAQRQGPNRLRASQWVRIEGVDPHPLEKVLSLPGLRLPEARMRELTEMKSPPAHALVVELDPEPHGQLGPRVVGAWGVQDPGNLGAIFRSAAAFGFEDILIGPGCADPFDPKTLRGSMGAAFGLRIRRCESVEEVVDAGTWIALDGGSHATPLAHAELKEPLRLLVGNEGHGWQGVPLPASVHRVAIPIQGVESLNASVAMGIACFEAARRRP